MMAKEMGYSGSNYSNINFIKRMEWHRARLLAKARGLWRPVPSLEPWRFSSERKNLINSRAYFGTSAENRRKLRAIAMSDKLTRWCR